MGTRSTYRVINQYADNNTGKIVNQSICLIYVQYDGYPDGHPKDTAEWLAGGEVVNELQFNGAGCLAAQLVAKLKRGVGGTYMKALGNRGKSGEDYLYDIIVTEDDSIEYIAYDNDVRKKVIFKGTPKEFVEQYS